MSLSLLSLSGGSVWPCDFQQGFCQWFQLNDGDFNWTRHQGSTASQNTGPDADATTGTSELRRKMNNLTIFFTPLQTQDIKLFDDIDNEPLDRGNLAIIDSLYSELPQ